MPAHHALRGVLLFVLGVFLFACMDASTKTLAQSYAVPLVVAARYGISLVLLTVVVAPRQGRRIAETTRTGPVLLRGACLAAASLCMGLALRVMPVGEASAIVALTPLLVILLAGPTLGERIGGWGWASALGGFAGVLLIARPGGGLDPGGVALVLGAVAASVAYQLLSRALVGTERTVPMLFWTLVVGAAAFGAALSWSWGGPTPGPVALGLFLLIGVAGAGGHYLFTAAHRDAPASALAPLQYLQIVFAGLLGWAAFGHVPPPLTLLGMGLVLVAGVAASLRAARPPVAQGIDPA